MTLIRIRPQGNGWTVAARHTCDCGPMEHVLTVRAFYGQTVKAAVWKFRVARREAQLVDNAFQEAP